MTIAHVQNRAASNSSTANQASVGISLSGSTVGNLLVLVFACDNNATGDGDEGAISSITPGGSGMTWRKAGANTNGQGSAQAGATVEIWWAIYASDGANNLSHTVNLTNNTSRDKTAWTVHEFSRAVGGPDIVCHATISQASDDGADPSSMTLGGLPNIEHLWVRGIASESSATTALTKTADFTGTFTQAVTSGGGSAANMGVRAEYKIATGATATSDPTLFNADHASVLVAFTELHALTANNIAVAWPDVGKTNKFAGPYVLGSTGFNWTPTQTTLTANAGTDPDGGNNAVSMTETTGTGQHYIVPFNSIWNYGLDIGDRSFVYWIEAKKSAGTTNYLTVICNDANGTFHGSSFNLNTGSLGSFNANLANRSITSLGNGWYRCAIELVLGAVSTGNISTPNINMMSTDAQPAAYAGSTSNVFLLGKVGFKLGTLSDITVTNGPALSENLGDNLTASNLTISSPVFATPSLVQQHHLVAASLLEAGAVSFGAPTLAQVHALTASALAVGSPAFGEPTVTEIVSLTASSLAGGSPVLDTPAIGQAHVTAATALAVSSPVLGTPAVTQVHALTATALVTSSPVLDTPAFASSTTLSPSSLTVSSPELGTPTIVQIHIHVLGATSLTASSPVLDTPILAQVHVITAAALAVASPALGAPTLTQIHALAASSLAVSSPVLDTPAISVVVHLTATALTVTAPVLDTPAIIQAHVLSATSLAVSSPVIPTSALAQVHALTATELVASSPTTGTPTITQVQALAASALVTSSPALGTPAVTQVQTLVGTSLTVASPVLATPTITQLHILSATSLDVSSPVLATPSVIQRHALTPASLAVVSPSLGSPALVQVHALAAASLSVGAPAIGLPAFNQIYLFVASALAVSSPVLDTPVLVLADVTLIAIALVVGSPVLATPRIHTPHRGKRRVLEVSSINDTLITARGGAGKFLSARSDNSKEL